MAEDKTKSLRAAFFQGLSESIDEVAKECESPIELTAFWAVLACGKVWNASATEYPLTCPGGIPDDSFGAPWCSVVSGGSSRGEFELAPQVPVSYGGRKYRIDLALHVVDNDGPAGTLTAWIAIECDGHDYHERTKEQAKRDKQKDRDLQSLGWNVARFTGSEIFRDPEQVANAVWQMVSAVQARQWDEAEARWRAEQGKK